LPDRANRRPVLEKPDRQKDLQLEVDGRSILEEAVKAVFAPGTPVIARP
jgi:hypothetical protein